MQHKDASFFLDVGEETAVMKITQRCFVLFFFSQQELFPGLILDIFLALTE